MKKLVLLLVSTCLLLSCHHETSVKDTYDIVPLPKQIVMETGPDFEINADTRIYYPQHDADAKRSAEMLSSYLAKVLNCSLPVVEENDTKARGIHLCIDTALFEQQEAYRITVEPKRVALIGSDGAGLFYGVQTLRKAMPVGEPVKAVSLPCASITDYPCFSYRGMHLDVCRHFMPFDSVKVYIDMIALHNMNRFHLHLSEDQGWRMEIMKYPELTRIGAYRDGTAVGFSTTMFDTIRHGGYYTQEQLRELVEYAAERYITIIPEIDLPGHMQSALACYPDMGCTGGPYEVGRSWGISDEVLCAGNEKAMLFLEDVLNEVMDVFPSELIHVGGDECPEVRWEKCPKCQAKIKELGIQGSERFSAEDYLQSYVMNRMGKVVNARGRRIIGWDEIMEGNVSKNTVIMSWRGVEEGIEAARKGYDVVMTPTSHLYFDYCQAEDPENEPILQGGYLPVERVYSFEPRPDALTEAEQARIIGVQGNIWTEHIPNFHYVQYNAMPRMAALAELQWCNPEQRDYESFVSRCFHLAGLYDLNGYFYARHIFDLAVKTAVDVDSACLLLTLSKYGEGDIFYTLDGSDPRQGKAYDTPIRIRESGPIRAIAVRPSGQESEYHTEFQFAKSSMKPVTLRVPPHESYTYGGAKTLIDAQKGSANYKTGRWIGFWGDDLDATIDLLAKESISSVRFDADVLKNDWIYNPKTARVLVSDDGVNFQEVASETYPILEWGAPDGPKTYELHFEPVEARYVEVVISGHDLPKGHKGYGYPAWVFVDEIEVLGQ